MTVTYMSSTNLAEPPVGWPINYFYRFFLSCQQRKKIFAIYLNFTINFIKLVHTLRFHSLGICKFSSAYNFKTKTIEKVCIFGFTEGLIEILQNFSARNIRREIFVAMLGPGEQRRSDGEHLRPPRQAGAGRDRWEFHVEQRRHLGASLY